VDSKLKLLDAALKDLDMGQGNNFLSMRATMLDARGQVRKDLYKPNGDVHLNISGTKIASLRIRNMLEIMLPNLVQAQVPVQAPVPAPVVVNTPSVVSAPLAAAVVNAHAVVQAPAGVQQLVGQVQDLVIQHVAVVPSIAMEVEENENEIFKRLFLKRFGRALPEVEVDVDLNMDLIDLTEEDDEDEMEVATPNVVVVVKTESIETPEAAPIEDRRRSSRLERASLRKTNVIQEKEVSLATSSVIADTDADMAEDVSANVESEPLTADEAFEMAEQAIAESDAAIAANQEVIDNFYNV
jgi:hypothetical protein